MKIGIPKEIKTNENRVSLVPAGAEALVAAGHTVYVEQSAGEGSAFSDEQYISVGAKMLPTADAVWKEARGGSSRGSTTALSSNPAHSVTSRKAMSAQGLDYR